MRRNVDKCILGRTWDADRAIMCSLMEDTLLRVSPLLVYTLLLFQVKECGKQGLVHCLNRVRGVCK